jgi:hypothetical protein
VRRRILIILLFPVIVPLFFVAWVLYVIGDNRTCNTTAAKRKINDVDLKKESTSNDDIEIGLIEEIVEEHS